MDVHPDPSTPATSLFALLLIAGLASSSFAQTTGRIGRVHTRDGRPVAGASVQGTCGPVTVAAVTDAEGTFRLDDVPAGACELTVTGPRLQPMLQEVVVGGVTPVTITVAESGLRLSAGNVAAAGGGVTVGAGVGGRPANQIFGGDRWGVLVSGATEAGTSRDHAGAGPGWLVNARATYAAPGGVQLTAGLIGRRGSALPLFMAQPLGSEALLPNPGTMLYGLRMPVLWDTQLRAQKRLKTTDTFSVDLVVEGTNLFKLHRADDVSPTLTSRSIRAGVLFGF
jgi:hypothetical protein